MAASNYSLSPSQLAMPIPEDYKKALDEALVSINTQNYQLRRSMKNARLMDTLKIIASITAELRTSILTPKAYYELYMAVFNELLTVASYLRENSESNPSFGDLYEIVQYTGNILPRLYLMITVGAVYIKLNVAPRKEILLDLLDMCRGIQHPVRGLFVREYLCSMLKDLLPTSEGTNDSKDGDVEDSIQFLLTNFVEMIKLWVRMQYLGPSREREKRETERRDLEELLGKNLDRLSQLDSLTLERYERLVLPELLEQIVACKDVIAQEYLMEILIQVFPKEFHLATLTKILEAAAKLHVDVNVKEIVVSVMDTLVRYVEQSESMDLKSADLFNVFWDAVTKMIITREMMLLDEKISLLHNLMNLSYSCYPENVANIDRIFEFLGETIADMKVKGSEGSNSRFAKTLVKTLSVPLEFYANHLETVLTLTHYPSVINHLDFPFRRQVCLSFIESFVNAKVQFKTTDHVQKMLAIISPLYLEQEDQPLDFDDEELVDDIVQVSKFLHFLFPPTLTVADSLTLIESIAGTLADSKSRLRFTLPVLVYKLLELVKRAQKDMVAPKKIFTMVHGLITTLERKGVDENRNYGSNASLSKKSGKGEGGGGSLYVWTNDYLFDVCFKLWLDAAMVADAFDLEELSYDLLTKSFLTYEDFISDSKAQIVAVNLMIDRLLSLKSHKKDGYESLSSKVAVYSARLLKRPDQCKAVCASSHLFWRKDQLHRDEKRVLDCLQKALKIADSCMEPLLIIKLFIEILGHYIYYMESKNPLISYLQINNLIEVIDSNFSNVSKSKASSDSTAVELQELNRKFVNLKGALSLDNAAKPAVAEESFSTGQPDEKVKDVNDKMGDMALTGGGAVSAHTPKNGGASSSMLPADFISPSDAWD